MERLALDVTNTFNSYRNWLWSSDFHKQFYLHKLFTTHFIFYPFRALHQVTYSTSLHLFHLFSFFQQSNDKTQVLLFPLKVLCFYVLDGIVRVSKSFEHPTHSKSTLHPISFFSSLTHSLISFISYTVSCITNLENSVHPFHFPYSSLHTHYQSAFKMLCKTIYPSFSTKKCKQPHILFRLKLCYRFELLLHAPSYTLKNNKLE